MSHLTARGAYRDLVERLNRFPQGAPPSDVLYAILKLLFSEREAGLVALLPIKPFTAATAARAWKRPEAEAIEVLDALAGRAILLDIERPDGVREYVLPPPMAGFFEFSMMRLRDDLDQALLARLFHQYLNVEDDFVKALFGRGETRLGRAFVNEEALPAELSVHVLDHERASEVVRQASCIGISLCYCRHKMQHARAACDAPLDICMTFGTVASSLTRHGAARPVEAAECLDLLQQARGLGLVQFGENVRERPSFICNCCGCCCEALTAARRFAFLHPVHTTNYLPEVDAARCTGCGLCVEACPVEAMALVSANDPGAARRKAARVNEDLCLGCGVCVPACRQRGLALRERAARVVTPLNSAHKAVLMAIERGMLQNLVFDNRALASHRAMAAILGVILALPPVKRALASRQLRSRYLERLLARK
ncbi:MAG: 4Fe-4S ferredoxin iron-sulfur binding domain protein [Acidobacteria bacterium]|nr:4Fe-4S ferredoxin iron-sulfur binding domain protein [Acidobacteriota bacterium]